jgi:hypothetical protein
VCTTHRTAVPLIDYIISSQNPEDTSKLVVLLISQKDYEPCRAFEIL